MLESDSSSPTDVSSVGDALRSRVLRPWTRLCRQSRSRASSSPSSPRFLRRRRRNRGHPPFAGRLGRRWRRPRLHARSSGSRSNPPSARPRIESVSCTARRRRRGRKVPRRAWPAALRLAAASMSRRAAPHARCGSDETWSVVDLFPERPGGRGEARRRHRGDPSTRSYARLRQSVSPTDCACAVARSSPTERSPWSCLRRTAGSSGRRTARMRTSAHAATARR